ncbi:18546_t:CDS:2 [Gigaspora margarita]|uniref:18546_t:CDS:1 n=1 Tax=Gigaspora margarita TaxID=4874 RepID=A0ABN7USB5_GIGMA|nr:18546_t:CDS:2 [Gigaspora margarita]
MQTDEQIRNGKADTLLETSKFPEEEMIAELSDLLKDKLLTTHEIITLRRRLDKTHKYEGIVRANTLTKRKQIQENEHDETLEPNMTKRQKKLKFSNMENNKETAFYNSYNTLEDNLFLEYPHNNNPLFWDKKVEFEISALKDTTNIWNNSSTEYSREDNETLQKPPTNIIEPEPMPNMSIQVEQTIEYETVQDPVEKKTQDTTLYREK